MVFFKIFFHLFCVTFWITLISSEPIRRWKHEQKTRIYDLTLKKETLAPDGFTRKLITVNGQFPGPTIEARKGDRIVMRIHNELGEPTTIHPHGMFQRGTPWFDGVAGQTQCLIPNNHKFTYDFTVPDQSGTYWYHSHAFTQYVDGLVGPLIIHDPDDPYLNEYDEEIIVMLTDYYHQDSEVLLKNFLTPESKGLMPVSDSGLINGKNSFNCSLASPGSHCVDNAGLAKFKFVPHKRYRLRIINTSAFSSFFFSIDKHEMEVIEVEGTYTKRKKIRRLPINVAQRYSVIVTANQPVDNYIMRSEFQKECMPPNKTSNLADAVKAIIHYDGAHEHSAPKDSPWDDYLKECIDLKDNTLLQPLHEEKLPEATKEIELTISFHNDSSGVVRGYLNNSSYVPDISKPTLASVFEGEANSLPHDRNAFIFDKHGEVVDVTFINIGNGEHPFHMHGHKFWFLGFGNGTQVDKSALDTVNPIKRDTATVPAKGWTVIRFIPDNPGVFAVHCHMEWHLQTGLLMQLIEFPEKIKKMKPPKEWDDLCKLNTKY